MFPLYTVAIMKLFDKTWKLALSGVVIGLLVMLLAMSGNPANMAICKDGQTTTRADGCFEITFQA